MEYETQIDLPVKMYIRFSLDENENEHAILVAKTDNGNEYTFNYETVEDDNEDCFLAITKLI